jgi:hypothetical protein
MSEPKGAVEQRWQAYNETGLHRMKILSEAGVLKGLNEERHDVSW